MKYSFTTVFLILKFIWQYKSIVFDILTLYRLQKVSMATKTQCKQMQKTYNTLLQILLIVYTLSVQYFTDYLIKFHCCSRVNCIIPSFLCRFCVKMNEYGNLAMILFATLLFLSKYLLTILICEFNFEPYLRKEPTFDSLLEKDPELGTFFTAVDHCESKARCILCHNNRDSILCSGIVRHLKSKTHIKKEK